MNRIFFHKAFITKHRNRALTYSLAIHLIAIIALAVHLFLTHTIEEIEDSIAVDILPPPKRQFIGIEDALGDIPTDLVQSNRDEIGDKLGSTIDESDGITRGHIRLIRLKHNLSDWGQDPTAILSLIKWLLAHQSISQQTWTIWAGH